MCFSDRLSAGLAAPHGQPQLRYLGRTEIRDGKVLTQVLPHCGSLPRIER
jgi:hypothetical protein